MRCDDSKLHAQPRLPLASANIIWRGKRACGGEAGGKGRGGGGGGVDIVTLSDAWLRRSFWGTIALRTPGLTRAQCLQRPWGGSPILTCPASIDHSCMPQLLSASAHYVPLLPSSLKNKKTVVQASGSQQDWSVVPIMAICLYVHSSHKTVYDTVEQVACKPGYHVLPVIFMNPIESVHAGSKLTAIHTLSDTRASETQPRAAQYAACESSGQQQPSQSLTQAVELTAQGSIIRKKSDNHHFFANAERRGHCHQRQCCRWQGCCDYT